MGKKLVHAIVKKPSINFSEFKKSSFTDFSFTRIFFTGLFIFYPRYRFTAIDIYIYPLCVNNVFNILEKLKSLIAEDYIKMYSRFIHS